MQKFDLELEYVFLIDPDRLPPNKNASEMEQMDAKRIYFYPSLSDVNDKRNIVGMVEGYLLFFNSFSAEGEEEAKLPQILTLENRFIIS